ncbi:MAG TPA: pyruvate kinase, partial [Candidatus Ozemobacteraceae bacterium]|nr:pyruvate kinase [Candidatus Ozemobacteraceae bacterium]
MRNPSDAERILTIGPASSSPEMVAALGRVATRFRLNTSHMSGDRLRESLSGIGRVFHDTGRVLPVVLDLQGAKVRIGRYPEVSGVPARVELRLADASDAPAVIPVPHESVFEKTAVGDVVHLNDRRVILRITGRNGPGSFEADCVRSGPLSSNKGFNCENRVYELVRLSPRDTEAIRIGNEFPFVEYAVSFVLDGSEAGLFRPLLGNRRLIAKIERPAALDRLAEIDALFDETWLCRGDLGAEADLRYLGRLQAKYIAAFSRLHKPKIL